MSEVKVAKLVATKAVVTKAGLAGKMMALTVAVAELGMEGLAREAAT